MGQESIHTRRRQRHGRRRPYHLAAALLAGPLSPVDRMKAHKCLLFLALLILASSLIAAEDSPQLSSELIFPLHHQHNHAPAIVECPNGDLLVSWYRGSGEKSADDVAVFGARRRQGEKIWSEPFVMADTPGFPDCNTAMFIDSRQRLWLFWPVI